MAGYTTSSNLDKVIGEAEKNKLFDSDADVIAYYINTASSMLWSRICGRQDIVGNSTMWPGDYDTDADPYPSLHYHCDMLTIDLGRWRKGGKAVDDEHPSLKWGEDVRMNRADVVADKDT